MGPSNALKRQADSTIKCTAPVKVPRCEPKEHASRRREPVSHYLIAQYFPVVITLREYALSRLPSTSRIRRKKISRVGRGQGPLSETETRLSHLLDTTLVGAPETTRDQSDETWKELVTSQTGEESNVTLADVFGNSTYSQVEIVDCVVWLLFSKSKSVTARPKHLLCDGFRKSMGPNVPKHGDFGSDKPAIPGLFSVFQNHHAEALKRAPWPELLVLLGKAGERIMMELLLDCSIFVSVSAGTGNMWQLSGIPLSDMESLKTLAPNDLKSDAKAGSGASGGKSQALRSPADISFVRSRILYARAALTAKGNIQPGLRHIHILNRASYVHKDVPARSRSQVDETNEQNTLRVMAYMFPRQFGLHNVFTSDVDRTRTAQKFQDYTLREEELSAKFRKVDGDKSALRIHLPKRLRGEAKRLTQRLQILHARCSYISLLEHYCPSPLHSGGGSQRTTQSAERKPASLGSSFPQPKETASSKREKRRAVKSTRPRQIATLDMTGKSVVDFATPVSHVSRFCQVVLSKIIPDEFWGTGPDQKHNKEVVLRNVDRFIRLRRFENISLHDTFQGVKISGIDWLAPPNVKGAKMSQPDKEKRIEIFYELLYYVFDSLLVPLLRCNFYVTESSKHKYRLFYFRHDVWRCIAEPATTALKGDLLEEVKLQDALAILNSRKLGTSHLRLVPKDSALRPIMNLKRRELLRGSQKVLGSSINTILAPVHSMFTLEKELNPSSLGSSMSSVSDLYGRLKAFRAKVTPLRGKKFYFVKVDVQSAFDTMPQDAVVSLMERIPSEARYLISKYVEVKQGDPGQRKTASGPRPSRMWLSLATAPREKASFAQQLEKRLAPNRKHTIFVNSGARRALDTKTLSALLKSHVEQNLVKVGKKYYRQKLGVPQGSVLSAAFCNYFYADLERQHLAFLGDPDGEEGSGGTVLLRLIDDFLLVTTSRSKAVRFTEVMHAGLPDYGVTIRPEKSLANFPVRPSPSSPPLPRCATTLFPYCGTQISTTTLSLTKDRTRNHAARVSDSLTVEASRRPGHNFSRKTLNAFRLQSHAMFYDTTHNRPRVALSNLRGAFVETARKACAYVSCLPRERRPAEGLVVATLRKLVDVAHKLLTAGDRRVKFPGYECSVSRAQVRALALGAFKEVMRGRMAGYGGVVSWIEEEMRELETGRGLRRRITVAGRRNAEA